MKLYENGKELVWNLLYPPRCPVCDRLLERKNWLRREGGPEPGRMTGEADRGPEKFGRIRGAGAKDGGGSGVCGVCRGYGRPERVRQPFCLRCGKPLERAETDVCFDCSGRARAFAEGRAAFAYRGMEDAMHRFKNGNRREYAGYFGRELYRAVREPLARWSPEVLVPIPIHRERRRKRGYNQAELLAAELSRRTGILADSGLLLRVKRTRAQRTLNDRERRGNLKGAFAVRRGGCPYESVLLVDDIYTTGSTADEAARALLAAGARRVYCASVCIGKGL